MPEFQLILVAVLALYVAWNLGANDVANSMGTSVGSKALTLKQALIVAGVLEFIGAVAFSQGVSATLTTKIVNPILFQDNPQLLLVGMVSVLLACGIWLQIATRQGLPVASSHAVVGAIAGFSSLAAGWSAVEWTQIGQICLAWIVTPLGSGAIAALFYAIARRGILNRTTPIASLQEWIPWLSSVLFALFGVIVFPTLFGRPFFAAVPLPSHTLALAAGGTAAIALSVAAWKGLEGTIMTGNTQPQNPPSQTVERILGRFQVTSACFVAFAHGSNDVGNAIAPLAAIVYILQTQTVPLNPFPIPLWILGLGGIGIVLGLAVQGKNVISTVGERIIPLQPSSGFCAELATATTILIASRLGFPVSTSHALVGAVVGIGLIQSQTEIRSSTLQPIILAWAITLPASALLCALCFAILRLGVLGM
ncbi:inorganic phosphate transporter [Lusitaniella coriacea]|uniref:inorganic phosphate transporter n=1 Tax=Lusitaniella coriacea TaxID=1983105 RepID=UPI003CF4648E